MATGDIADMAGRLYALIPNRWFPSLNQAPVLNALLSGVGTGWSYCYQLLTAAIAQARIGTASGPFLDMIAGDFFSATLPRRNSESDDSYRSRILGNLLRERATRNALASTLADLTGGTATIVEPTRPADTGGYGSLVSPWIGGGFGYGVPGLAYGSLAIPFSVFVTVDRSLQAIGSATVGPYGSTSQGVGIVAVGGYGVGALEYVSVADVQAQVTDSDILGMITSCLPAGVVAWTRLTG